MNFNWHKFSGKYIAKSFKISLFLKPFAALLAADFIPMIFAVGFTFTLGRVMRESALGVFYVGTTISILLRTFAESGYEVEIPRLVAAGNGLESVLEAQFVKNLFLTALLPIGIIYILFSLPGFTPLLLLIWNYPFAFAFTLRSALRGLDKSGNIAVIESLMAIVQYGSLILSIFLFSSIPLIFILMIVFESARSYVYFIYLSKSGHFSKISFVRLFLGDSSLKIKDLYRNILSKRKALFGINIFSALQTRVVSLMMGLYLSPYDAGIYSAAARFPGFMRIIPGALLNSIVPLYSSGTHPRFRTTFLISCLIALLSSLFLYFGADFLIKLIFNFPHSASLLMIMAGGFGFSVLHQTLEGYMLAHGLESKANTALFFTMIFTLLTSIALNPILGLRGFAVAYSVGELTLFASYLLIMYRWNGRRRKTRD